MIDGSNLFDYEFTLREYLTRHPPRDYLRELDLDDPILTKQAFSVAADREYQRELQVFKEKKLSN